MSELALTFETVFPSDIQDTDIKAYAEIGKTLKRQMGKLYAKWDLRTDDIVWHLTKRQIKALVAFVLNEEPKHEQWNVQYEIYFHMPETFDLTIHFCPVKIVED